VKDFPTGVDLPIVLESNFVRAGHKRSFASLPMHNQARLFRYSGQIATRNCDEHKTSECESGTPYVALHAELRMIISGFNPRNLPRILIYCKDPSVYLHHSSLMSAVGCRIQIRTVENGILNIVPYWPSDANQNE
jgi:hypothetical protein